MYSMFTMSGAPSNSKVWMMNSFSRTVWKTPLNQYFAVSSSCG